MLDGPQNLVETAVHAALAVVRLATTDMTTTVARRPARSLCHSGHPSVRRHVAHAIGGEWSDGPVTVTGTHLRAKCRDLPIP